jgi:putative inorganic carbon (hco3(-)) transporter
MGGRALSVSVARGLETVQQVATTGVKRSRRTEPLAFAFFGLVLFLIVYFARPEDWIPGLAAVPLAKITGILILVALVFSFGNIRWRMPQEIIFLTVLVALLWLSALFSPVWRGGAVDVMLDFSKVLPLVIVIYGAVRSMNRLRWILFIQAASVAAVAIATILNRETFRGRLQGALNGVYGNPNDLALVIDLSLPLCLALALTTRSYWQKIAWTAAMLAMVYAVMLTASRGGAIALVVAALVCLWQLGVKSRRYYLLLLVPAAVLVFWLYSGNALQERFGQTSVASGSNRQATEAAGSAEERKGLLIQSLKITGQYPFLGVGPSNFTVVSGVWRVTHNTYTQISAEGGIPAFVLYVLIFWRAIVNLKDVGRHRGAGKEIRLCSMALQSSLAAYLVGTIFASDAYQIFPYCLVAYTSGLRIVEQTDRKSPGPAFVPQTEPSPVQMEATIWE